MSNLTKKHKILIGVTVVGIVTSYPAYKYHRQYTVLKKIDGFIEECVQTRKYEVAKEACRAYGKLLKERVKEEI